MSKREMFVDIAKKILLEKGYHNISVDNITKEAGVSKGSFYTYFKAKEDLINYILQERVECEKENLNSLYNNKMELKELIDSYIDYRIDIRSDKNLIQHRIIKNLFKNIDSLSENTVELLLELHNIHIEYIEKIIAKGKKMINIDKFTYHRYASTINSIIRDYKIFEYFESEKYIDNIEKKENFKIEMEVIKKSIISIID